MITLFRKIRKSLLASGASRKYVYYAVGEIALVVIGILIALQINNWNEERKDRIIEQEYLIGLRAEFEYNFRDLEANIRINEMVMKETNEFIQVTGPSTQVNNIETIRQHV